MSARSYKSWASRQARSSARSCRSTTVSRLESRPSSSFSLVESNFRVVIPETPVLPEVYIQKRNGGKPRHKEISINDAPMMLLPKARVRDSLTYYDQFRRSYSVVADTDVQGLHISTIQSVTGLENRTPQKSVLKSRRNSISRSEADSGFCSLKRAVTFDNLSHSQNSVYRSDDDFDNLSDDSDEHKTFTDGDEMSSDIGFHEDFPEHLDSFRNDGPVFANPPQTPPRPPSRTEGYEYCKRRRHGQNGNHDVSTCEICGVVLSETDRVKRKFGKVDNFLNWVLSRWGPRKELQYVPRPSYVYRNHVPHFCNFVQQISLHDRPSTGKEHEESQELEFDEDVEFIMESAEGRLISRYRKTSSASSRAGLTQTPKLEDYETETVNDNKKDIENWLNGKKVNKAMFKKYFSSIPEMKEDIVPSGTEGRPGSPSSLDGDSRLDDDAQQQQQPVTGIEVRLSSPVKSDQSVKSLNLSNDDRKSKTDELLSSRSAMSIPEEKDEGVDLSRDLIEDYSKGLKSADSANIRRGSDSDNNNRAESPRQPPPSPEPLKEKKTPAEIPLPTTQASPKKRGCVSKKTKKPVERTRKMKQVEESKEVEPVKVEETPPTDTPTLESDKVDSKVDLKVPDLPSNLDTKEKSKKEKSKPKRHLIDAEDDLFRPDPTDFINDQMRQNRTEFDWSNMDTNGTEDIKRPPQIKSWISGRLALSQQSSRFELPMDMKNLEAMTPQEYIKKHCIITSRRHNLYQKIFMKNKDKSHTILYKDLDKSLKDVLVNTITSEQVQEVLKTLNITESTKVDFALFAGMAAFAERVLYPSFVTADYLHKLVELEVAFGLLGTEDTHDMPEYQREKIECADFSALPWKLHGVNVNPDMRKLLEQIS